MAAGQGCTTSKGRKIVWESEGEVVCAVAGSPSRQDWYYWQYIDRSLPPPPGHSNTRSANCPPGQPTPRPKISFSSKIYCVPFLCPLLLSYSVLKDRGRWAIGGGGAGPSILSTEKGKCNSIIERINPELFAHCSFSLVQTGRSFNWLSLQRNACSHICCLKISRWSILIKGSKRVWFDPHNCLNCCPTDNSIQ